MANGAEAAGRIEGRIVGRDVCAPDVLVPRMLQRVSTRPACDPVCAHNATEASTGAHRDLWLLQLGGRCALCLLFLLLLQRARRPEHCGDSTWWAPLMSVRLARPLCGRVRMYDSHLRRTQRCPCCNRLATRSMICERVKPAL